MKLSNKKSEKVLSPKNIIIAFSVLIYYVIIWNLDVLLGVGSFNAVQFLIMFVGTCIGSVIQLYAKAQPEKPIPKKPTKLFANLAKAVVDSVVNHVHKEHPLIDEMKSVVKKSVIWHLREAEMDDEIDQEIIDKARSYIFKKLFADEKGYEDENGEIESEN
jgi:hypothetical protein